MLFCFMRSCSVVERTFVWVKRLAGKIISEMSCGVQCNVPLKCSPLAIAEPLVLIFCFMSSYCQLYLKTLFFIFRLNWYSVAPSVLFYFVLWKMCTKPTIPYQHIMWELFWEYWSDFSLFAMRDVRYQRLAYLVTVSLESNLSDPSHICCYYEIVAD